MPPRRTFPSRARHSRSWSLQSGRPRERLVGAATRRNNVAATVRSWLSRWHTSRLTALERERAQLDGFLRRCDSPLEQLLLLTLLDTLAARPAGDTGAPYLRGRLVLPGIGRFSVAIRPQQEVTFSGSTYRADFLVSVERWDWNASQHRRLVAAVVEVDGHRYHERTRAQAEHDRSRDRRLTAAGFLVLRFTGREVNRDPRAVAGEVTEFLKHATAKAGTETKTPPPARWRTQEER